MKVSIVIPYKTDRGYLEQAIASCEAQEGMTLGEDFEIILQQGDYYASKNFNDGVKRAKGKYIKRLDEDDELLPNCLKDLYDLAESGGYDFVCADSVLFYEDEEEDVVNIGYVPETIGELAGTKSVHMGTALIRRDKLPLMDETLWTAEDFDMVLRMADAGCRFGYLNTVVFRYRIWKYNKSNNYNMVFDERTGQDKYRMEYVEEIQEKYLGNKKKICR